MENRGFLKEQCQIVPDLFMVYKCLTSEKYYTNLIRFYKALHKKQGSAVVTRVCEGDPRIYQACSLTVSSKILNSETICDKVICPDILGSNQLLTLTMATFDYCKSYQKFKLMCRPTVDERYCSNFKNQLVGSIKECDGSCQHDTNCEDEALCNGFRYGKFCSRGGKKHYIKATMICDESSDCDDLSDEQQCSSRSNIQFVCSGRTGKTIFNYTRCAPIEINLVYKETTALGLSKYSSYCLEFEDQYNCSDPLRGVLNCTARSYPSTISSGVLCLDITPLCDNGLDQDCTRTSPLCLVHKHLLCNGISDCEDKSDEQYSECEDMSQKCNRW